MNKAGLTGLGRRLCSIIYDGLLVLGIWMFAALVWLGLTRQAPPPGALGFQLYLLATAWLYFAVCWRRGGQTLGMRAWRIRLESCSGQVSWPATVVRFITAWASALVFGLGFLWSLGHRHGATWHDLASGTRLVTLPRRGSVSVGAPGQKSE